jgi:superfamily II DNA or RNA helicase
VSSDRNEDAARLMARRSGEVDNRTPSRSLPNIMVTLTAPPSPRGLRRWQQEAIDRWNSAGRPPHWLTEATPGSGKTTYALAVADALLRAEVVRTVSTVCPTAHLRTQWQEAAHRAGIELCTEISASRLSRGFDGAALTYQQVLAEPSRYRHVLGNGWVAVDECHHAGEGKSWGEALRHAFGGSRYVLSLSGTAFRSDASRIPFVRYGDDGVSAADYRYSYGEALRDGVVRPVYFVSFAGAMAWQKRGKVQNADFTRALGREDAAARLRTALDAAGGWMGHALESAHRRLLQIRKGGHPDAAGLVVCIDQTHARAIAARLAVLAGRPPALALSDDPEASAVISRFTNGRDPWIVAVRQVSEGTDIPRLRVGLWATTATTELFFRQVVGRLVRTLPGLPEQDAYLYLPADPTLLGHARALADERSHHLPESPAAPTGEPATSRDLGQSGDFTALGSTASAGAVVASGHTLQPEEIERARLLGAEYGLICDDPVPLALALREAAGRAGGSTLPVEVRIKALRELLSRRVRQLCARTGQDHRDVFAWLKRRAGRSVDKLDESALAAHVRRIETRLEHAAGRTHAG